MRAFLEQNEAAIPRLTQNFVPKMPSLHSTYVRAFLE
jgi:hypothetical protein